MCPNQSSSFRPLQEYLWARVQELACSIFLPLWPTVLIFSLYLYFLPYWFSITASLCYFKPLYLLCTLSAIFFPRFFPGWTPILSQRRNVSFLEKPSMGVPSHLLLHGSILLSLYCLSLCESSLFVFLLIIFTYTSFQVFWDQGPRPAFFAALFPVLKTFSILRPLIDTFE
jgi:hypothetical protein